MKAFQVKIYPSKSQAQILSQNIGACRYIYNRSLAVKKFAYQKFGWNISAYRLCTHLTRIKRRKETTWLQEASNQALQQSILHMEKAYKAFFKLGFGYPRFKSKGRARKSCSYVQNVSIEKGKIRLPKAGWMRCKGIRKDLLAQGKLGTVVVFKEAGAFYASVLVKPRQKSEVPSLSKGKKVGIDVGVKVFIADSDGRLQESVDFTRESQRLLRAQKKLSRKKKASKNRAAQKLLFFKAHQKIARKRKDYAHKLSRFYADNYDFVAIEDLNLRGMTRSAKGTLEAPGKNISAKSGLNRAILQQGWSQFFQFLDYKLLEKGGSLVRVDPKNTSQKCSECGHVSKKNRVSQELFFCEECGHTENADLNAAKNIALSHQRNA